MNDYVIQTENVCKIFKDFWRRPKVKAVDGVTFSVKRGEVFGLLGPNGSGKSTTIKMILGLLFPTSGHISVFGKNTNDVAVKKRIGFLPEESYLYKYLDAEETLDFYGRLFDLSSSERKHRIDSLLKLTGLTGAKKRLLGEYSKGMARRIGIAQALINDPELIILDEPTTGLDPIGTREIKDLIVNLKEKGKTILLCSHLLADVEDVCDKLVIMYGGKIQTEGKTDELLQDDKLTQIVADIDPQTLEKVVSIIKENSEDGEIKVSPPAERLESFFLKIVEKAQQEKSRNDGAGITEKSLDFITDSHENIIEKLSAIPVEKEKVTDLENDSVKTTANSNEAASSKNIDENVINKLTRKD